MADKSSKSVDQPDSPVPRKQTRVQIQDEPVTVSFSPTTETPGLDNQGFTSHDDDEENNLHLPNGNITHDDGDDDSGDEDGDDAFTDLDDDGSESPGSVRRHHAKYSMTTLSTLGDQDMSLNDEDTTLIYSKHEKLPNRDFLHEVRGMRDIEKYLNNMCILLDVHKTSLDEIINEMLTKMLADSETPNCFDQARSAIFTHDRVHQLCRTVQSTSISEGGGFDYEQNWICVVGSIPALKTGHICIAHLRHPSNMGVTAQEVMFVILVLAPTREKGTKNALETARTFSSVFRDLELRSELIEAHHEEQVRNIIWLNVTTMCNTARNVGDRKDPFVEEETGMCRQFMFCKGIKEDLQRRLPHYLSDFKDGVLGHNTIPKVISTTLFLYFACILPCIAFGVLNHGNTDGYITVEKVLISQTIGGLAFVLFAGTPHIVLLTTAPLALFTKLIKTISDENNLDFPAMFGWVGIWTSFFLTVYSVFGMGALMQFSTRSSEEIFAVFISIAFAVDAFKDLVHNIEDHYWCPQNEMPTPLNITDLDVAPCETHISLLYIVLMFGTLWLGITLFNFTKTPYLTAGKREQLADYALPITAIIMAFFGSYVFRHVKVTPFEFNNDDVENSTLIDDPDKFGLFVLVRLGNLPVGAIFGAMGLGLCLSLLFFMDQNISASLINAPQNKLKKGTSYHWDLLIIAIINVVLSLFCLPWVHATLPHSPLHVKALADVEERVDQGHIYQIIIRVRETRLTGLISHIMIGASIAIGSYLSVIPVSVLYGLFLYIAVTALYDNQMFERILLLATEQAVYPPNHYIRRVPQRKIHIFTVTQLIQLLVLCGVGFAPYPYLKMLFPVLIFILIPIRHKLIPKIIETKYLNALDSGH